MEKINTVEKSWTLKILIGIMSISIAMSSWFLSECWSKITTLEGKVQSIELTEATHIAKSDGTRFTSGDWMVQKNLLDSEKLLSEKRLVKVEESMTYNKEALIRIENTLKDHANSDKDIK